MLLSLDLDFRQHRRCKHQCIIANNRLCFFWHFTSYSHHYKVRDQTRSRRLSPCGVWVFHPKLLMETRPQYIVSLIRDHCRTSLKRTIRTLKSKPRMLFRSALVQNVRVTRKVVHTGARRASMTTFFICPLIFIAPRSVIGTAVS